MEKMKTNQKILFGICILYCIFLIGLVYYQPSPPPINSDYTIPETQPTKKNDLTETQYIEEDASIETLYVEDFVSQEEIEMIAKVLYREARGVEDKDQIAAVAWCILNRVDHPNHPNTIKKVITQPEQFAWVEDTPVEDWLLELANDVVYRWYLEKEGQEDVGRTLPKGYCFFIGDGKYNYFRQNFNSKQIWNWSYPQQY